jgi:Ca2+-transporting ATPase
MNWHLVSVEETESILGTGEEGLDAAGVLLRQTGSEKNLIPDGQKKNPFLMVLNQFTDFMVLVLAASSILSGFLGEWIDAWVILSIIFLNALMGFLQEYRAEKALEALKKMAVSGAKVRRGGQVSEISAAELVTGDLILLEAGNIISADVRFRKTFGLMADESALTGESQPVEKDSMPLPEGQYMLGDRLNMGFKGTHITKGRAEAYVVAIGIETELGKIAGMIRRTEESTPLQKRLAAFGKRLSFVILLICLMIFAAGMLRGESLIKMILTSVSLAVAAIPEALPALATIALAMGAGKLAGRHALIRKLPAVESLGSVTFICTDKTGTLTRNKMRVESIEPILYIGADKPRQIITLTQAMVLNNDARETATGHWTGDSTEVALMEFAFRETGRNEMYWERIGEIPFDSNRKCMTTIHKMEDGFLAITKGAPEVLIPIAADGVHRIPADLESKINGLASDGFRIMAYGFRILDEIPSGLNPEEIEKNLTLIGFAALRDPAREEAFQAVAECRRAGVTPVMITGDHKLTAVSIARSLGILSHENDIVLTGEELCQLSDAAFLDIVEHVKVYARVSPDQKLKIVKALQTKGQIVAMTGDGVNDAPALKNADIGVAMGNGTDVSREAAHMILMDDNFATIVHAIKEGRRIYDNILKFIKYIMTSNSGEIWTIFLAPFFGLPIPLFAIQILWVNLITDGLPGLALAAEKAEPYIMNRPPRPPSEGIFSGGMAVHILWVGFLMGLSCLAIQWFSMKTGNPNWQTMVFSTLCLSQLGHVLAIRSGRRSLFQMGFFANPGMLLALLITVGLQLMIVYVPFFNPIFRTTPLSFKDMVIVLLFSSVVFTAVELEKWVKRILFKAQSEAVLVK